MSLKSDQLKLVGIRECRELGDPESREPRLSAPQSTAASVDSDDIGGVHLCIALGE